MATKPRKAIVTPEHLAEAARLREIWDSRTHPGQTLFGERYEIGGQSAVGQFLNGQVPLSLKAARGFARGLGVQISEFSPRLANLAAMSAELAVGWPFPDIDRSRFDGLKDSQRYEIQGLVRERLERFEAANRQEERPLGAPVAPDHLETAKRLSEDAEAREADTTHGKKQRRRPAA